MHLQELPVRNTDSKTKVSLLSMETISTFQKPLRTHSKFMFAKAEPIFENS